MTVRLLRRAADAAHARALVEDDVFARARHQRLALALAHKVRLPIERAVIAYAEGVPRRTP